MEDYDAWLKYPQHHKWFNKLWLAEKLGYQCGPAGIRVPKKGYYIVRPIYNLAGMGIGAERKWLVPENNAVLPGYFWCEYFEGKHYSIDYEWYIDKPPFWRPCISYEGIKKRSNLSRFTAWYKTDFTISLSSLFYELGDVRKINVESIEENIIEIHLRPNPDPGDGETYETMIPIWQDSESTITSFMEDGYRWVESYDDGDGDLNNPRVGFVVK
jgi:hypothetical protein|tara:strand:- start:1105 stop:1746 length:642 start_codon:yes stop_codon:yes gene_type:complete